MVPLRGWAPKGARLRGFAPHGHWRTMTFLGALRCDRLTAPCVFDGPINGECFRAYVEQLLVPCLRPGDIVIMDNLGSHKSAELRRIIRAAGARLWYLPPYSPDLNPIEQAFAKIKHWMRAAQKRTVDEVWRHIGGLVSTIQARDFVATLQRRQGVRIACPEEVAFGHGFIDRAQLERLGLALGKSDYARYVTSVALES